MDIDLLKFFDLDIIKNQNFLDFDLYVYNPKTKQADLFLNKNAPLEQFHHDLLDFIHKKGGMAAVEKNYNGLLLKQIDSTIKTEIKALFAKSFEESSFKEIIEALKEELTLPETISYTATLSRELVTKLFTEDSLSNRVVVTSYLIYKSLSSTKGRDKEEVARLICSCYLHHLGLTQINRSTFLKPKSQYTDSDLKEYQRHVAYSLFLSKKVYPTLDPALLKLIYSHHEKVDGTGYPEQLKNEQVDLLSSILSFSSHIFEYSNGDITGAPQSLHSIIQAYQTKKLLDGLDFNYSESLISTIIELTNIIHTKHSKVA